MINLLYPVLEATEYLSGSSYPMISNVHLTVGRLIWYFDHFIDDRSYLDKECIVADSICYKLNEYWSLFDKKITVAAILNLSLKLKTFSSEEKITAAITKEQKIEQPPEEKLDLYFSLPICQTNPL
ncbi:347_t:CDS:2, partial [Racocetra persica]